MLYCFVFLPKAGLLAIFRFSIAILATMAAYQSQSFGDVVAYFADVQGPPRGDFGWDDFNGAAAVGPHTPDQFSAGMGSGSISGNGGVITSTRNLYSLLSVPVWTVNLSGLENSQTFSSIAVQFATSATYLESAFTLNGAAPDELFRSDGPTIGSPGGNSTVNIYWAEWQGLAATNNFSIQLQGTGQHQSLHGVRAAYFNTSSFFNITAVPEPGALALLSLTSLCAMGVRRRQA